MIEGLNIPRVLDLSTLEDRKLLRECAQKLPWLASLIDDHLDEYLAMFPEPHGRKVYSGGLISIETGAKQSQGFELGHMLRVAKSLQNLKIYKGFEKLMAGFRNPPQIPASLFEVEVADWCISRAVTKSLEFSPHVIVKGNSKYPDFLWKTDLGDLYCECKRGDEFENKFTKRLNWLHGIVETAHQANGPWDPSHRLDVSIWTSAKNGVEQRINNVLVQASTAVRANRFEDKVFQDGEVSAILRFRKEMPSLQHDTIRVSSVTVGTTPTALTPENAHLTLTMSVAKHRERAATHLLRQARSQSPSNQPGAVFISLGGPHAAQKKLQELMVHPAYENTPWAAIWGGEIGVVWRNGQPFDGRLLSPHGAG